MTEQARNELRAIIDRLNSGMWLKLDRAAFPHYFGHGHAGKAVCSAFADKEGCIALIKQEGDELSVEFSRAYPKRNN